MDNNISLRDFFDTRILTYSLLMPNLAHYDASFNIEIKRLVSAYHHPKIDTKINKCLKAIQKNALKIQDSIHQEPMQLFIKSSHCGIPSVVKECWPINPEQPAFTIFIDERVPDFEMDDMNDPSKNRKHDLESIFDYFYKKLDLCIKYLPKAIGNKGGRPPATKLNLKKQKTIFLGYTLKTFFNCFVNAITNENIKRQSNTIKNFISFAHKICIKIQKVHKIDLGMSEDFPEKDEKCIRHALEAMKRNSKPTIYNHRIFWNPRSQKFEQTFC